MTIEPVVLRPPMNLGAAAASRRGKGFITLLAPIPRKTASNRDFVAASISLRFEISFESPGRVIINDPLGLKRLTMLILSGTPDACHCSAHRPIGPPHSSDL